MVLGSVWWGEEGEIRAIVGLTRWCTVEPHRLLEEYPLISRCGKLSRIIDDTYDGDLNKISFDDLPGGAESFELASKFYYGITVDLTAAIISGLRCVAEDSVIVLKSCEDLSPWAKNLQIVRRCSESIAWKACANPKGIKWNYTGRPVKVASPIWNEMKEMSPSRAVHMPPDWLFEDVSILRIDHFVHVITAIRVKGMRFDLIGASVMHYATKCLPGVAKNSSAGNMMDELTNTGIFSKETCQ
ncbi:root phototropism protein 3-like [Silene latifolia]|uniref:root phototropism protein 3-like n=1 Tax=Silene latifolia TaxID=37657 RepID=UPI003D77A4EB